MDGERQGLRRVLLLTVLSLLIITWVVRDLVPTPGTKSVPYSEVVQAVEAGRVAEADLTAESVVAKLREPDGATTHLVAERVPNVDEAVLLAKLLEHQVVVTGHVQRTPWWLTLLAGLLPFLLLGGLFWMLASNASGKNKPLSFGRSKAKLYDKSKENAVTFADVAGVDEAKAELTEVVRFLKDPAKYTAVGARIPKGVLLVGPPGTGKTLLARAVAGEAAVPFFSMSGSEFVEMFVGVGAARVRDLFEQSKSRAPCIIFIDELDAVGKTRSGPTGFATNEEREQTLNQLLVEMDGFDSGAGLIIMAATNRPEILDKALLRAGRFDRQVVVDRPDVRGRLAILEVHAARVKLGPDVALDVVAQRTPGMVGADLANVVNEAALASVRRGGDAVTMPDFEEAVDRLQLGLKKEGRVMTPEEKRRVATHEAGHALVALNVEHADPVHRVTIIPRSIGALGATLQLPTDERYLMTKSELLDQLCVLMGGRVAEELVCHDISTGAQNDLERATELARLMVTRFGMSETLGPQTFGRPGGLRFLGVADQLGERDYSEQTALTIDGEVRSIVEGARARALGIVADKRDRLEAIAKALLEEETLQREELEALARGDQPENVKVSGEGPATGATSAASTTAPRSTG